MKKSFHIGLIKDEQDIEDLATEMRKYLKTLGEFCFCVGKDTNENRDSCAKSLFRHNREITASDTPLSPHSIISTGDSLEK